MSSLKLMYKEKEYFVAKKVCLDILEEVTRELVSNHNVLTQTIKEEHINFSLVKMLEGKIDALRNVEYFIDEYLDSIIKIEE